MILGKIQSLKPLGKRCAEVSNFGEILFLVTGARHLPTTAPWISGDIFGFLPPPLPRVSNQVIAPSRKHLAHSLIRLGCLPMIDATSS